MSVNGSVANAMSPVAARASDLGLGEVIPIEPGAQSSGRRPAKHAADGFAINRFKAPLDG